jgi:hypothetical protein
LLCRNLLKRRLIDKNVYVGVTLAGNGHRTSDSKIVRAALQAATANRAFLAALKEAEASDLRYKREE